MPLPERERWGSGPERGRRATRRSRRVQIKGDNVFWAVTESCPRTIEEFTPDGWFRTGDLGRFDGPGRPGYCLDPSRPRQGPDHLRGLQRHPKEVEGCIDAMPGVSRSAVVGLQHADSARRSPRWSKPRAPRTVNASEADRHSPREGQLANFKVPKRVLVVTAFPRNTMGKVQKNVLREQVGERRAQHEPLAGDVASAG